MMKSRAMKKNTLLLIDGENISHNKAEVILQVAAMQGVLLKGKVYGRQSDPSTKGWSGKAKKLGLQDIRLYGTPEKDKVDKKMQKDARKEIMLNKSIDIICFATSDGGFANTITELRALGKRVVVIGEKKAPASLRKSCNKFLRCKANN